MQRRTFIGGGAAALAAAATAACNAKGSGGKAAATDAADTSLRTATTSAGKSGTGSGVAAHAAANWTALAKDLDGSLVRPGDRSWSTAHQLYNTRFDSLKPTAVAYVAHADDIRTTMAYARAHNIPLSIRNGGHSYAGWSSGNGRLILDVSKLNTIRASANEAVVGAGSKLIDVYRALAAKGVTIPAGSCPTVGVSGLTLGGGHGVVSRAYGLTCDSLTQATLITADGKQVVANASENKDLFWALRGAGERQLRCRHRAALQDPRRPAGRVGVHDVALGEGRRRGEGLAGVGPQPAGRDLVLAPPGERQRHPHRLRRRLLPGHLRRTPERRGPPGHQGRRPRAQRLAQEALLQGVDGGVRGLLLVPHRGPVPSAGLNAGPFLAGRPRP